TASARRALRGRQKREADATASPLSGIAPAEPARRACGLDLTSPAPAALVLLANDLGVRHGADDRADSDLLVALDRSLLRAPVLLSPDQRNLVADLDVGVHRA